MNRIVLDQPLAWSSVAQIATQGARLELAAPAKARIKAANAVVRSLAQKNIRAYGVNTGVGALSDATIPPALQRTLSRNILMSHAVGVGAPLSEAQTRAIMVASINNFAHGYSGLRLVVVETLVALLNAGCFPLAPRQGSLGYLSHAAHINLALIGHGEVMLAGERLPAARALEQLGLEPLELEAKEGLCLVNGTPCVTGLACLALDEAHRLMDWADAVSAMTFEIQHCQLDAIDAAVVALRPSPGLNMVAATLRNLLADSNILAKAVGRRTQDALSLRAIPHIHGAARDSLAAVADVVSLELASVTDNPAVSGSADAPVVRSQAHAVGTAISLAMDQMAIVLAQLGMMSERRLDRLVNPLVSGLPAFLAEPGGVASGFMIAQYAAASLVGENRLLAAPASLGGGVTSGLQEDVLSHGTSAALKTLDILANLRAILAIEYLAACQAYDILEGVPAPRTGTLYRRLRDTISTYADDRPLSDDIAAACAFITAHKPQDILSEAGLT